MRTSIVIAGLLAALVSAAGARGAEIERARPLTFPADEGRHEGAGAEIWTLHGGRATHYRGYPLDEGLAVLSETTRSRKLELLCRAMLAFNRGDKAGWMRIFTGDGRAFAQRLEGTRLDDVEVLGETFEALVVAAAYLLGGRVTPVNLVLTYAGERVRRVEPYPTPADALDAAARWSPG